MSSEAVFTGGGLSRTLTVRRVATARTMRLAVDPRDGTVRLTLPPRLSEHRARAWAERQREWIETALARLPMPRPLSPGAILPFRGEDLTIDWSPAASRTPRIAGNRLIVGGPVDAVAQRVLAWARTVALAELDTATRAVAARAGVTVGRVGVGDARSRWGSCTARGDIRYSWRLILAPRFVLDRVVAHEVAHRFHMDHGAAFHAAERDLLGSDPAPARMWLRTQGAALYWIGAEQNALP